MEWSKWKPIVSVAWGLVLFTLCFRHTFNGAAILLLTLIVLMAQFVRRKPDIQFKKSFLGLIPILFLFLLQVFAYFYFEVQERSWFELERKLPLLAIPVLWVLSRLDWAEEKKKFYLWFCSGLLVAALFMLGSSAMQYFQTGELGSFTYHQLTAPVPISPIYYAWYLLMAVFWPINLKWDVRLTWALKAFFSVLLFLASSKLLVVLYLLMGGYWLFKSSLKQVKPLWAAVGLLLIVILSIPVAKRFLEMKDMHLELVTQEEYQYDSPFNGLTLRLVQWRFGWEVIAEDAAWVTGAGPALKQQRLNERYAEHGMYMGNPNLGDRGYQQYNYHNQYVETFVAHGLPGLACLLLLVTLVFYFRRAGSFYLLVFVGMGFMFMLTESVLERQQGIVPFVFWVTVFFHPSPAKR